jgi:hypothetical protein
MCQSQTAIWALYIRHLPEIGCWLRLALQAGQHFGPLTPFGSGFFMTENTFEPNEVLDLWFPQTSHETAIETHGAFWDERMQGGMDTTIVDSFGPLTIAAVN